MIVMIKTTNVNMDVAAEKPGRTKVEGDQFNTCLYSVRKSAATRWSPLLTIANSGEEQKPEETENGGSYHLVDSSRVDLLVQFGGQISVVHVVPVCQVFQQHVHQSCTDERGRKIGGNNPIKKDDKHLYEKQKTCGQRPARSLCVPHSSNLTSTLSQPETGRVIKQQNSPKGTMIGQVMLQVITTVKTHIIQA